MCGVSVDYGSRSARAFHGSPPPRILALQILGLLVASRVLLTIPALIGAHFFLVHPVPGFNLRSDPAGIPGVWERWDAGSYMDIARRGYLHGNYQVVFFPAYPLLARALSLGNASWIPWAAYLISNVSYVAAGYVFWEVVSAEFSPRIALYALLSLDLFPTSFFFSSLYAESLFVLFAVLVYRFSTRGNYLAAAICVSLASLTRPTGIFLAVIPLIDLWQHRRSASAWSLPLTTAVASIATIGYSLYLNITQGSPTAYAQASHAHWGRYFTVPWSPFFDSLRVAIYGYPGDALFPRLINLSGVLTAVLFGVATAASWAVVRLSLAVYMTGSMVFFLSSHGAALNGLESLSRYVLALFPAFIVFGVSLDRAGRRRWLILTASALALCFLTGWYASGRWVA